MLSYPETVYVRFKRKIDAKVGDRYIVYRTVQEVKHPTHQGEAVGFLTELARHRARDDAWPTSTSPRRSPRRGIRIMRGDLVGPYGERLLDRVAFEAQRQGAQGHRRHRHGAVPHDDR